MCKPLHVAEHHRDLLSLTFDLVSLGKDLFGKALGEITLNFVDFLIKREVFWGSFCGKAKIVAAFSTEFETW
jgi:hypothetical protein